ncbi:hypothetical protein ACTPOK_40310 [Streptomyces inhibens]|uniref:hypothetical protein n=1 Tax=Streptomyces inhibens TaxID=2293571 RepID=UPI00402AE975
MPSTSCSQGLDDEERQLLSAAATAWLNAPDDQRDTPHLLEHISQLASAIGPRIIYNSPTATGQDSIAAVKIEGTIHMGGRHRPIRVPCGAGDALCGLLPSRREWTPG